MLGQYLLLLRFEWISEKRKRNTLPNILLYLACILLLLVQIHVITPLSTEAVVSLYWVIQLFLSVWIAFESIQSETPERMHFWYQHIPVHRLFVVKCVYNMVLSVVLSNLIWMLFSWFLLDKVSIQGNLFVIFSLASLCFVWVFTFVSYLVFILQKQMSLATVLGTPILLPLLLITIKFVKQLIQPNLMISISVWDFVPIYSLLCTLILLCGIYLLPYLKHH